MAAYETGHPGYRADLEARHRRRGGAGGGFKAAVARLGLKLPRKAEDLYYKAKTEVQDGCRFSWLHLDDVGVYDWKAQGKACTVMARLGWAPLHGLGCCKVTHSMRALWGRRAQRGARRAFTQQHGSAGLTGPGLGRPLMCCTEQHSPCSSTSTASAGAAGPQPRPESRPLCAGAVHHGQAGQQGPLAQDGRCGTPKVGGSGSWCDLSQCQPLVLEEKVQLKWWAPSMAGPSPRWGCSA